jgi:hypothetical protein
MATFAIFGAFIACGFGGAGVSHLLGLWDLPIAGFFAAFAAVSMTYLSVPSKNSIFAAIAFLLGCILAWVILEPSSYPESYPSKAYQPTHLPLIATVTGSIVALGIFLFPDQWNMK